jgi:hypothetical protein
MLYSDHARLALNKKTTGRCCKSINDRIRAGRAEVRTIIRGGTEVIDEQENVIRYKWNPKTATGYRLRYDAKSAQTAGHRCYHVEDWTHHVVMDHWGCSSLDEALDILKHFIDIDVGQERHRLEARFPTSAQ